MEGGVSGAEGRGLSGLATANDSAAAAHALQFAVRSVRAGPARVRRLRTTVHRARLRDCAGAGDRWAASRELRSISATSKAWLLLGRAGHGEAQGSAGE